MKKVLFILFVASLFVGCKGYKWQKAEKDTQTVHILDIANFAVKGEVDYDSGGIIEFTDMSGRLITTHISKCVVVSTPFAPKAPPIPRPVQVPTKKDTVKQSVKTPKKVPNKGK